MNQNRLEYVDVLRGLAILGVVAWHYTSISELQAWLPKSLQWIAQQGAHGVLLFFIASASTLFRSYHHRSALEPKAARNFFIRRYFRIAPMYYFGIAYFLWQDGVGPHHFLDGTFWNTPVNVIANVFFVNEISPYYLWLVPGSWSVATEMLFYLLVPLLFRWIPDLKGAIRFLGIALVIRTISWQVVNHLPWLHDPMVRSIYASWVLPTQLPIFALGILLFYALRGDPWPKFSKWDLLAGAAFVFAEVFTQGGRIFHSEIMLGIAFLLMAAAFSKLDWSHWLGIGLRHIGKVSFSMYVLHWGVIHWLDRMGLVRLDICTTDAVALLGGYVCRFALVFALVVLLSTITYELIEKPGQRLGSKFIDWLNRRQKLAG